MQEEVPLDMLDVDDWGPETIERLYAAKLEAQKLADARIKDLVGIFKISFYYF